MYNPSLLHYFGQLCWRCGTPKNERAYLIFYRKIHPSPGRSCKRGNLAFGQTANQQKTAYIYVDITKLSILTVPHWHHLSLPRLHQSLSPPNLTHAFVDTPQAHQIAGQLLLRTKAPAHCQGGTCGSPHRWYVQAFLILPCLPNCICRSLMGGGAGWTQQPSLDPEAD